MTGAVSWLNYIANPVNTEVVFQPTQVSYGQL